MSGIIGEEKKPNTLKKTKTIITIVAGVLSIVGTICGIYFGVTRNNNNNNINNNNNPPMNDTSSNPIPNNSFHPTSLSSSLKASSSSSIVSSTTNPPSTTPSITCSNGGGVQLTVAQDTWCMTDWYNGACKNVYPKFGRTTRPFTSNITNWQVGGCVMSAGFGQTTWFKVSCNNGPWVDGNCVGLTSTTKDCLVVWNDGWNYNPRQCPNFQLFDLMLTHYYYFL
ncbi:unnamed protein product [Cunninghamella blakesleeana]